MNIPEKLKYTSSHEWARLDDNGILTVGITAYAQSLLGDMVYVELPEVGVHLKVGAECCVVESVKAAADVYSPLSGEIIAVNTKLNEAPELVNTDPYGDGWLFQLRPVSTDTELQKLMSAKTYAEHIAAQTD
jgi:glycine cleavage system H protein